MNQSLWQKLRRIKLGDFLHIVLFLLAIPLACLYRIRHKDLWLLSDCPEEARDNAFCFFEFLKRCHPKQEAIFALRTDSPDMDKVRSIGRVVNYGSFKHWVFYLAASNNISSQKAGGPNAAVCYMLDRFSGSVNTKKSSQTSSNADYIFFHGNRSLRGNKIFLQHGIIKDNISFLYYKYTHIRLFTCSTQREMDYVRDNYGYPRENVQLLGLCRFDRLLRSKPEGRLLLIMPTWRKWLCHPTGGISKYNLHEKFLESDYFKQWSELLCSPQLQDILIKNGWHLLFYLHREAQMYSEYFAPGCVTTRQTVSRCPITVGTFPKYDVQELLIQASVLITDYSSVAMDFAFMGKPLLYYQFDYEEFRSRHLEEGYFSYINDGFGPVCNSKEEIFHQLDKYFACGQMENSDEYKTRRINFFTLHDDQNCLRTYQQIKKITAV